MAAMTNTHQLVNIAVETSSMALELMQPSQDMCSITLYMTGPWRHRWVALFFFSIADAINQNDHRKAVSLSRGFFYVNIDILAVSTKPHRAKEVRKSPKSCVLLSFIAKSKSVSITWGKKILLETGDNIWLGGWWGWFVHLGVFVCVFFFIFSFCTVYSYRFQSKSKAYLKLLNASAAAYIKNSWTMVWKAVYSPTQSCHPQPPEKTTSKAPELWCLLLQGALVWGLCSPFLHLSPQFSIVGWKAPWYRWSM